jgi:hypothetical protein
MIRGSNPGRVDDSFLLQNVLTITGPHPAFYSVVPAFFLRVKRLAHEVDHSPPSGAEIE